ncbi:unnamed protein product [Sympodiomycopsis kandeliae]
MLIGCSPRTRGSPSVAVDSLDQSCASRYSSCFVVSESRHLWTPDHNTLRTLKNLPSQNIEQGHHTTPRAPTRHQCHRHSFTWSSIDLIARTTNLTEGRTLWTRRQSSDSENLNI